MVQPTGPTDDEGHAGRDALTFALDRTVLANERTYASWIRTGLTALAAGVAIEKFMVDVMPGWIIRTIALTLIVFSAAAFLVAAWRYTHLGIRIADIDVRAIPSSLTTAASLLLVLCSALALVGLWLLDPAAL
jgi:inner membrane protein YidH